ncbi:MAG: hypothetical protein U0Q15_00325 [Kineosporiaceae bacterium]
MPSLPQRRRDLLDSTAGMTPATLRKLIRSGDLWRLQRGWYQAASAGTSPLDRPGQPTGVARLSALARAAALSTSADALVSHAHAAAAWGLPVPLGGLGPVDLTAEGGRPQAWGSLRLSVAAVPRVHRAVDASGIALTSPARTVLDCARRLHGRDALAIADAALRSGLVSPEDLLSVASDMRRWPGIVGARAVLTLADAAREAPLESWSAWAFDQLGVPPPRWQVTVHDEEEHRHYRLDCLWDLGPGRRVAGEADGRSKALLAAHERGGASAQTLARVLDDERRREVRVRRMGFEVVRWGTLDVVSDVPARRLATFLRQLLGVDA